MSLLSEALRKPFRLLAGKPVAAVAQTDTFTKDTNPFRQKKIVPDLYPKPIILTPEEAQFMLSGKFIPDDPETRQKLLQIAGGMPKIYEALRRKAIVPYGEPKSITENPEIPVKQPIEIQIFPALTIV